MTSPRRYHDRLGEAGIDFAVLYPSFGNALMQIHDEEERVTLCRVYNEFLAEQYRPYGDRFTVAALVPMHTPDEAVAALEHIKSLGSKVALIPSHVHRPLPGEPWPPDDPWADVRIVQWETHGWVDTFGIDSIHDYDPVWAKAVELGLPIAAHTAGIGASDRASISNFVFNQIGHFAASGAALAKSLFLGGVTARFPDLRVALQEGGAAIGVQVYVSLVGNWLKRGGGAITGLDPERMDKELCETPRRGRPRARPLHPRTARRPAQRHDEAGARQLRGRGAHVGGRHPRPLLTNFYWGCEADDPLVGVAFNRRVTPSGLWYPRSSPRTSVTGTCPTSTSHSRKPSSSSNAASSTPTNSATSCSSTRCGSTDP